MSEDEMASGSPLAGLRVLDLSRVLAGPYAAQMLADHGADVVKVEAPTGDETRRWGPPFIPELDSSAYYHGLNRSKRNICLDLSGEPGREVLAELLARADVVVENFKIGTMAKWGFDYDTVLVERHPGMIYCRISGFGADGPMGGLPGYDAVLQAFGGLMSINGEPHGEPMRVGVPIVDLAAANLAFSGVLLALLARGTSGRGQFVDVSLLDAVASIQHPHSSTWLTSGTVPVRTGAAHPVVAPYQTFSTASGSLFVSAASDRHFAVLCAALGKPELATDPRFATNGERVANLPALQAELVELIGRCDLDELSHELTQRGIPASPVHDIAQALSSPQVVHRNLVVNADGYRGVGVPIKLGRSTPAPVRAPVPIGHDTDAVLAELGYTAEMIAVLRKNGACGPTGTTCR